ncbi:hypothetical protein JYQ62_10545 [Nostoc sp. UHCC 0702]|nr:hypothetical protein JYQ62_10545 [Nostoc sp. UHCC 0702]
MTVGIITNLPDMILHITLKAGQSSGSRGSEEVTINNSLPPQPPISC